MATTTRPVLVRPLPVPAAVRTVVGRGRPAPLMAAPETTPILSRTPTTPAIRRPIYPAVARRREQQGTVTVRVLVGADGSVERAEIADSSGFDALDDAALDTVRSRWRFVPARRAGLAVESWVLVPIRFALLEANAVR